MKTPFLGHFGHYHPQGAPRKGTRALRQVCGAGVAAALGRPCLSGSREGHTTIVLLPPPLPFHGHAVSAGVELDPRHEGLHQHHASAARGKNVVVAGGIGQGGGIETAAFVGDFDANPVAAQQANEMHVLGRVEVVAMMDGIGQGLFGGQVYGEDVA